MSSLELPGPLPLSEIFASYWERHGADDEIAKILRFLQTRIPGVRMPQQEPVEARTHCPTWHGDGFGLELEPAGEDPSEEPELVVLYVEDDGYWHRVDSFSPYWLPELAQITQEAVTALHAPRTSLERENKRLREALQSILNKKSLAAPSLWQIAEDALKIGA